MHRLNICRYLCGLIRYSFKRSSLCISLQSFPIHSAFSAYASLPPVILSFLYILSLCISLCISSITHSDSTIPNFPLRYSFQVLSCPNNLSSSTLFSQLMPFHSHLASVLASLSPITYLYHISLNVTLLFT